MPSKFPRHAHGALGKGDHEGALSSLGMAAASAASSSIEATAVRYRRLPAMA
jgi:hypothetical protein